MRTGREKAFETERVDEWLQDGETARLNYHVWRNEVVCFKFRCECGGESWSIPVSCQWPDSACKVQSICKECGRILTATIHFFIT